MIPLAWSAKVETDRTEIADTVDSITSIYVIYFLFFLFVLGPIFGAIIVLTYMGLITAMWMVRICITYLERHK